MLGRPLGETRSAQPVWRIRLPSVQSFGNFYSLPKGVGNYGRLRIGHKRVGRGTSTEVSDFWNEFSDTQEKRDKETYPRLRQGTGETSGYIQSG